MTEDLIESIRAALATDATPVARAAGVTACRTILTALGATAGEPLGAAPTIQVGPAANAVAALLRSAPPDQLLDLLIGKLRSMVPADAQPTATHKMTIPYVKVPSP